MLPQRRAQSYRGLSSIASKMHQSSVVCFEAIVELTSYPFESRSSDLYSSH